MAQFVPSQNQNRQADCGAKMSQGRQVGEETRCAKFGVDPSMEVFRRDMRIFRLSFFFT